MKQMLMNLMPSPSEAIALWWQRDEANSYDKLFLVLLALVICVGIIMVTSASVPVAERLFGNPLHFTIRHLVYLVIGLGASYVVLNVPVSWWHNTNILLLMLALALLIAVLLFGRNVNGSTRWLALGPFNIQAAEPAKLFFLFIWPVIWCVAMRKYGKTLRVLSNH